MYRGPRLKIQYLHVCPIISAASNPYFAVRCETHWLQASRLYRPEIRSSITVTQLFQDSCHILPYLAISCHILPYLPENRPELGNSSPSQTRGSTCPPLRRKSSLEEKTLAPLAGRQPSMGDMRGAPRGLLRAHGVAVPQRQHLGAPGGLVGRSSQEFSTLQSTIN